MRTFGLIWPAVRFVCPGNLHALVGRQWSRRAPPATALQLVVPLGERRGFIQRYHDSIFSGHLGVSRTVCRLLDRVY